MDYESLIKKSIEIREKTIEFHSKTKIPHLGSDLSSVEILTVLYHAFMKEKDVFILSKGHASGIFYIILNDKGIIPEEELYKLEEHPAINKKYCIEATTGSLGHGLSIGVGMAIADKDNKVCVLIGDGECDEGQIWEAARTASELNIQNLICLVDCNGLQGFKSTDYANLDKKFEAFGWEVRKCDGHDCKKLLEVLEAKLTKPLVILAKTIKGKGLPYLENQLKSHYSFC